MELNTLLKTSDNTEGKMYSRVYASINLNAIDNNFSEIKRNISDTTKVIAVIKTDGYGHGAVEIAKETEEALKSRVNKVKLRLGFKPVLATIIVGDDPASVTYVSMKAKACERIGMESIIVRLKEETTTEELLHEIDGLNNDNRVCEMLQNSHYAKRCR